MLIPSQFTNLLHIQLAHGDFLDISLAFELSSAKYSSSPSIRQWRSDCGCLQVYPTIEHYYPDRVWIFPAGVPITYVFLLIHLFFFFFSTGRYL